MKKKIYLSIDEFDNTIIFLSFVYTGIKLVELLHDGSDINIDVT